MAQNRIPTTEQGQRLLALGLLLLPFLLFYLIALNPYLNLLAEKREKIADLTFQLRRLQRTAAQEHRWKMLLESLKESQERNQHYLPGTTPALASAELQEQLRDIVRQAGGEITSTQVLATKDEESFKQIAIRIRFYASTPSLRDIVHGIESNQPLLLIESLNIRPSRVRRRSRKSRNIIQIDKLNVDMLVVGYMATPKS